MQNLYIMSVLLAAAVSCCSAATLSFSDSPSHTYLKPGKSELSFSAADLSSSLRALLGARPLSSVDTRISDQVDALLVPDIFQRPQAVLTVHLAGLETGEDLQRLGSAAPSRQVAFADKQQPANRLMTAIAQAAAIQESDFAHQALDHTSLPGCGDACIEESLKEALAYLGANYTVQGPPMNGLVATRTASGKMVELDLSKVAERLWAVELASLYRTALDVVAEKSRREAQSQSVDRQRQLLDCSLVGLQALKQEYGSDSPQFQAAGELIVAVLSHVQASLCKAFNDRLVTMTATVGNVAVGSGSMKNLIVWREAHRRRSLLQEPGTNATSVDSLRFSTSAAAWSSGLVIVFFLITGIYCLTTMQFKQDSLLYPRQKAD